MLLYCLCLLSQLSCAALGGTAEAMGVMECDYVMFPIVINRVLSFLLWLTKSSVLSLQMPVPCIVYILRFDNDSLQSTSIFICKSRMGKDIFISDSPFPEYYEYDFSMWPISHNLINSSIYCRFLYFLRFCTLMKISLRLLE